MKKFLFLISLIFLLPIQAYAIGVNADKYFSHGVIYTGSKYPQSVANNGQNTELETDLSQLKQGKATAGSFFGLVEVGNASIDKATKNAGITKIHYIDTNMQKVYIPYFIIPISARQRTTIVYGE